jgi:hypothetical protein
MTAHLESSIGKESTGYAFSRGCYLNLNIPIKTRIMIANITAPKSPNRNQPMINAMTDPSPSAPQFIVIAV